MMSISIKTSMLSAILIIFPMVFAGTSLEDNLILNKVRNNLKENWNTLFGAKVKENLKDGDDENYMNQDSVNQENFLAHVTSPTKSDDIVKQIRKVPLCESMLSHKRIELSDRKSELSRGRQMQKYLYDNNIPSVFHSMNPMGVWLNMIREAANSIANPESFALNLKNKQQDKDFNFSVFFRVDKPNLKTIEKSLTYGFWGEIDETASRLKMVQDALDKCNPFDIKNPKKNIKFRSETAVRDMAKVEGELLVSTSPSLKGCAINESFIDFYVGGGSSINSGTGSFFNNFWDLTKKALLQKRSIADESQSFWGSDFFDELTADFLDSRISAFRKLFDELLVKLKNKKNLMIVIALYEDLLNKAYISKEGGIPTKYRTDARSSEELRSNLLKLSEDFESDNSDAQKRPAMLQVRVLPNNYAEDSCHSASACSSTSLGFYRIAEPSEVDVYNHIFEKIQKLISVDLPTQMVAYREEKHRRIAEEEARKQVAEREEKRRIAEEETRKQESGFFPSMFSSVFGAMGSVPMG